MAKAIKSTTIDPRDGAKSFPLDIDDTGSVLSMRADSKGQLIITYLAALKGTKVRNFRLVAIDEEVDDAWVYQTSAYLEFSTYKEDTLLVKREDATSEFHLFEIV